MIFIVELKPFNEVSRNLQEICNDAAVVMTAYLCILFTDYINDIDESFKRYTGFIILGLLAISLLFNLLIMTVLSILDCKQWLRRR